MELENSSTYIRFSTGNDIVSWAIRQRTGCVFSHIDFLLPGDRLLGALPKDGVAIRSSIKKEKFFEVCEVPVAEGYKYAYSQLGKPYDWSAIVGLALPFPRDFQQDDSWFCSELVAASLLHAGYPIVNPHVRLVTPRDLLLSPLLNNNF